MRRISESSFGRLPVFWKQPRRLFGPPAIDIHQRGDLHIRHRKNLFDMADPRDPTPTMAMRTRSLAAAQDWAAAAS